MARSKPAVRHPLHPDSRVVDEPGRGLVLDDRAASDPPGSVQLGQGPQRQDPRLHRRLDRPLASLRVDQDSRRDPQEGQPDEDFKCAALAISHYMGKLAAQEAANLRMGWSTSVAPEIEKAYRKWHRFWTDNPSQQPVGKWYL